MYNDIAESTTLTGKRINLVQETKQQEKWLEKILYGKYTPTQFQLELLNQLPFFTLNKKTAEVEAPNNKPKFYLEISARQSGKTSRLVENIIERMKNDNGEGCYIVYVISDMNRKILAEKLIGSKLGDKQLRRIYCVTYRDEELQILKHQPIINQRYFDEFDFFYDKAYNLDYYGYYCTTARRLRSLEEIVKGNSYFDKLIRHAKAQPKLYTNKLGGPNEIREYIKQYGERAYVIDCLGKFMEGVEVERDLGAIMNSYSYWYAPAGINKNNRIYVNSSMS